MKKKIISMITALACAVCAVGVMPATDDMASAESYSDDFSYGDYLKYCEVDENEDGHMTISKFPVVTNLQQWLKFRLKLIICL